jgi:hypothetical protein
MDNKKILVLGDSHTYGDGLKDVSLEYPWKGNSKKTWPYHMFDPDNIENRAYPGCSNDMIFLKLVRHIKDKDLVLIMFTYAERLHLTKKSCNFTVSHNGCSSIADNGEENWLAKQIAEQSEEDLRRLFVNHYDDNMLEINMLKNILSCQLLCEQFKIDYYFTMVECNPKTKCLGSLKEYRDKLFNSINWKKIFLIEGKHGFKTYGHLVKADLGLDGRHLGEDYHTWFGEKFIKHIKEDRKITENQI